MEFVLYEQKGQYAIITINREKALNALNSAVLDELDKTLDSVDLDQVRCLTFAEIVFCCTNYAIYYKLITISCFITVLNILAGMFKNRKEAYSSCYLK